MPNSNNVESRFYAFVLTYYRNDPYIMLDKFHDLISNKSSEVSINWDKSRGNVALNRTLVKGKNVIGMEKNDAGRGSIIAFENTHTWERNKVSYTIKYPSILFKNHRIHFDKPVLFDGYKALMEEYERYKAGERVYIPKINSLKTNQRLEEIAKREEEDKLLQSEAVNKDRRWLEMLHRLEELCPYFSSKGLPELGKYLALYVGETTLGFWLGRFTAIVLKDVVSWEFRGLQRYYHDSSAKVFRKGLGTTGACVSLPDRSPVNGELIYVIEAVADAAMSFKLTGDMSIAALYADNIPIVVSEIRKQCPDSPIIMVADNDQYPDKYGKPTPNKGVDICESTLRATSGNVFMVIPQFKERELGKKYKDLTDYCSAYGEEEATIFLKGY